MPLADEFFFIAHDVQTGKLRLNARSAGLGLAGGLLGELVLHGNIDVANGTLTVVDGQAVPEDDLGYRILRQLAADRQNRSLRTWLLFFSQGALERVGVRLSRAGHVEPSKTRRPWGTVVRYMPTDVNMAVWPADRLNVLVGRTGCRHRPDQASVVGWRRCDAAQHRGCGGVVADFAARDSESYRSSCG